ncbi:hypothetical protein COZ61_02245 [Candidatus Berkelbacteria bacterium CG_4_8_14_3_um_filter_33_6]|uniref:General secretion pathway GspH domain-containing protein n=1 Tax=Candidatus Berkelbacteria bacterium CG_4_10_14_0_2_um_filter_35_9_33_12 TaxID=1974499 RepID=A0A2M7W4Z5_9BACT|nr:MAG: hypothetical protein COX10_00545 [Candidatus Berkelbacteria bacterium CG23_combo_of_CG06-09_8_20_14_all_33_15]PIS08341.1 MAG: hypothetical protein COT76_01990 [Candidatus Berkelbacteria bacterium CG10_big_fil_rev_8_21_14_0_10_33_10]PIX30978.1 MAG: hypothetical protein COZ61_02245 [Candidatus Berkelbacteria bacterium CG_4_8_14_3_um_filter_33_6]PIZ28414.1 MAG: hypothetical protein COY43_00560 [Candidatus Berkelbacteria bacterium CG_4_10_14_0_8_um_filter_35_9_33_8]PJA20450.1 MAG: hypotheti
MKKTPLKMGFSLIELLVTISILVLLTGLTIPSYRSYQRKTGLDYYSKLIKNEIQFARSYSLSPPTEHIGFDMFGVTINTTNNTFQKIKKSSDTGDVITIESPLIIDGDYTLATTSSPPEIYFEVGRNGEISSEVVVELTEKNLSQTKTITVNQSGLITIN